MQPLNIDQQYEQKLISALANSVNPAEAERTAAEQNLREAQYMPGFASTLLKISTDQSLQNQFPIDINHAASIQFGRLVELHWKFKDQQQANTVSGGLDFILLDEGDKQYVRDNLLAAVCAQSQNRLIVKQYVRSLRMICVHDYPEKLPHLLSQIVSYLNEADNQRIFTGLLALKALAGKYEFERDASREPLYQVIGCCFERLGELVNQMINNTGDPDALYMLLLVCKVFYAANQLSVCPFLMEGNSFDPWIQFFKTILDLPAPPGLDSATTDVQEIERRDQEVFWKLKGLTSALTFRILAKYGNPVLVPDEGAARSFSAHFCSNYAVPLLESQLQILFSKKESFVGSKALNFSFEYVSAATRIAATMEVLKPYVDNLLYDTLVPMLFATEHDVAAITEDPIEFIRKQPEFAETTFSPKSSVPDLLRFLCQYSSEPKSKPNRRPDYLYKFLDFTVKNLNSYNEQLQSNAGADWRIKEALMVCIGALRSEILAQHDLKAQMEPMLMTFVLPELQSDQPFMRLGACRTYAAFGGLKLQDVGHVQ